MPSRVALKERFSLTNVVVLSLPAVGIAALAAGFYIRSHFPLDVPGREAAGASCDAVFIACFLAWLVDPFLKRRLMKEALENIFKFVYGYKMPSELQDFWDANIAGTKVIRRECELHWKIDPHPDDINRVLLRLDASFDIVNYTHQAYVYRHAVMAISDTPGENGCVDSLYCTNLERDEYEYNLGPDEFKDLQNGFKAGHELTLRPRSSQQSPQFRVGALYLSESSKVSGADEFNFAEVTAHTNVLVIVNEALKGHVFSVHPAPPDGAGPTPPKRDPKTGQWRCRWKFNRLFVPNETMILRWQHSGVAQPEGEALGGVAATR